MNPSQLQITHITCVIYRHNPLMCKPGLYAVVCTSAELADMQDVEPWKTHPACTVDDFGNLVRARP